MKREQAVEELIKNFDISRVYADKIFKIADKNNLIADASRIIGERPKPFVKWVGGKRQLLAQFYGMNICPPEKFNPETGTYFEPFVGGGAVFFDLLPEKAVLSDLNEELVTAFNVIKNDADKLIKSLRKHKADKEYFLKIRAKNPKKLSDVEVASRFIFLNKTCFNGMYRVNNSGGFNVPFGKYKKPLICDEANLRKVSRALQGVTITSQDFREVLKDAKKGDFIYLDPPYYPLNKTSFTSYTKEDFLEKEQTALRDTFVDLHKRGCFVMLSNSDTKFINELYSGLGKEIKIHKVYANRAINSKGTGRGLVKELVLVNY